MLLKKHAITTGPDCKQCGCYPALNIYEAKIEEAEKFAIDDDGIIAQAKASGLKTIMLHEVMCPGCLANTHLYLKKRGAEKEWKNLNKKNKPIK